jgi:siroheme synthase-like protein
VGELIDKNSSLGPINKALIIGSGKLAKGIGDLLFKKGIKPYFVAGRSLEKARQLAARYDGEPYPAAQIPKLLQQFSLIIGASKANQILLKSNDFTNINGQFLLIDLSAPGIIDPDIHSYKNVEYIGLSIIEFMIQDNLQQRQSEIEEVEFLVAEAVEEMLVSLRQRHGQEQIGMFQERLYQDGQSALINVLSGVTDENLRQSITKQWNEQLGRIIYMALSSEKNEKLLSNPVITNNYFPIILSLHNRRILVVGGGKVATRKILKLLEAQAKITIVAPELEPELLELSKHSDLQWRKGLFKPEQIKGFDLIIAATNDHEVNLEVVNVAHEAKVLVNSVEEACFSDFLFPALIRRGDLLIAISTSGKRPALARKIRQELEFLFNQGYGDYVDDRTFS